MPEQKPAQGAAPRRRKPIPPWLMGLILAVAVALVALAVFNLLGFGDDPSLESAAMPRFGFGTRSRVC